MPFHPAVVHVPLGIALAIPFVALHALAGARRARVLDRARWLPVVLLQAIALAGGLAALRMGEAEEETARKVVARAAIHEHHERGEVFVWLTGLSLEAGATALVLTAERMRTGAAVVSLLLALLAAVGTYYVGSSGGELVYRDGAARAYAEQTPPD
jgi:uncharacterized membrane protein